MPGAHPLSHVACVQEADGGPVPPAARLEAQATPQEASEQLRQLGEQLAGARAEAERHRERAEQLPALQKELLARALEWRRENATLRESLAAAKERVESRARELEKLNSAVVDLFHTEKGQLQQWLAEHSGEPRRRAQATARQRRGILMAAGGSKYIANAFVTMHVVRHHLGCTLPIAVM